jgi:hypothetical protein
MKLGVVLGKLLSGESVIRDFLTIGIDDNVRERVYLRADDQLLEVTRNQWLLGLDPRIIGIWSETPIPVAGSYTLFFRDGAATSFHAAGDRALGILRLDYVDRLVENNGHLFLFRVQSSAIHHIDAIRTCLLYRKYYKKPGVDFERLKAVAAAYTYPRRVRIISFQLEGNYNYIFPMDLLADIKTSGRYLLGMRHSNQVLKKIMEIRKIVVAEVPARYKALIYQLGRNHSVAPPALHELPFATLPTKEFGFYVPEWVESYKEITIDKTLDLGSHMLLCGQWKEEVQLKPATPRLHHIHFLHFLYLKSKGLDYPVIQ